MARPHTYKSFDLNMYRVRMGYACYYLVCQCGYTQSEAARILDCAQSTVSRHLSRYLTSL